MNLVVTKNMKQKCCIHLTSVPHCHAAVAVNTVLPQTFVEMASEDFRNSQNLLRNVQLWRTVTLSKTVMTEWIEGLVFFHSYSLFLRSCECATYYTLNCLLCQSLGHDIFHLPLDDPWEKRVLALDIIMIWRYRKKGHTAWSGISVLEVS